jgi:hypothetical protein
MFYNCQKLTSLPNIGPNVSSIRSSFIDCRNITVGPKIYAQDVHDMWDAFKNCVNMVTAPDMNDMTTYFWSDGGMNSCFDGCTSLTGDIYIGAVNANRVRNCFNNTSLIKNVYIPYGTNTYNAFINAGYDELGTQNGV